MLSLVEQYEIVFMWPFFFHMTIFDQYEGDFIIQPNNRSVNICEMNESYSPGFVVTTRLALPPCAVSSSVHLPFPDLYVRSLYRTVPAVQSSWSFLLPPGQFSLIPEVSVWAHMCSPSARTGPPSGVCTFFSGTPLVYSHRLYFLRSFSFKVSKSSWKMWWKHCLCSQIPSISGTVLYK